MPPFLVAAIGVAILGLGIYGVRDFRRWNSRRTGSIRPRDFLAIVFGVLAFPALVILGVLLVLTGITEAPARV